MTDEANAPGTTESIDINSATATANVSAEESVTDTSAAPNDTPTPQQIDEPQGSDSPKEEASEENEAENSVEESKTEERGEMPETGIRVLFLSSDTGGGHRASAQSLARQFELLFPGSTYDLLDLATEAYLPPYNSIVPYYKHLSANPSQWKMIYGITNSKFFERFADSIIKVNTVVCERTIRKKIKSYVPDVVVSVHPLQTSVPILSCAKISNETGKHLPMFTVVTDLGSAHLTWFANGVEKMFVGSSQIYDLAKERGKVPDEKLVLLGLPIRHDFAVEADRMGDRMSVEGKKYQLSVREKLDLPAVDRKTLLVMGGGEGVGSLSNIVDALYCELAKQSIDAVICVVCGRNAELKASLENRNWSQVFQNHNIKKVKDKQTKKRRFFPKIPTLFTDMSGCTDDAVVPVGCIEAGGVTKSLRKILSTGNMLTSESAVYIPSPSNAIEATDEKKEEKLLALPPSEIVQTPPILGEENDTANCENESPEKKEEQARESPRKMFTKSLSTGVIQVQPNDKTEEEISTEDNREQSIPVEEAEAAAVGTAEQGDELQTAISADSIRQPLGKVEVVGLGFITNMAEYMVAADILITKAGPGTISEAAALSLPVMLTSFLPGQEEGNVDYVVKGGFGAFCQDTDTEAVAEEVAQWLNDEEKMKEMSEAAKLKGAPYAARDIVQMIGESTLKWREHNKSVEVDTELNKYANSSDEEEEKEEPKSLASDDAIHESATPSLAEESTTSTMSASLETSVKPVSIISS